MAREIDRIEHQPTYGVTVELGGEIVAMVDGDSVIVDGAEADRWWSWHDADYDRAYATTAEAEAACAAWVLGWSDVGPER
jgi:hypothetical protein